MIQRNIDFTLLKRSIIENPVTAILGARQVGKSTLAQALDASSYFDLENPRDLARLEQPQLALEGLVGLVVIDEIQRKPELFTLLRFLVDENAERRFLVLGSASRDLIKQSSESLAGRIAYHELGGFSLNDIGAERSNIDQLWMRGGFPRSYLAKSEEASREWRRQFVQTYLERDIPQLGLRVPSAILGRFWRMLSHYHGQLLNYQELSRSFGVSDATVRNYLGILEGTFMIRLLQPWHENLRKRLVKSPKLYIRDSGLFHSLQDIPSKASLEANPKLGASWEGFVLEQAIRAFDINEPSFYRTHAGAELDLVWMQGGKRYGVEIKYADAPALSPSMRNGIGDLGLDRLFVVYPGDTSYKLAPAIDVVPVTALSPNALV